MSDDRRSLELRNAEFPRRGSLYADHAVVRDPGVFLAAKRAGLWLEQAACGSAGFGGRMELLAVLDARSGDAHLFKTAGAKLWRGIELVPSHRIHPGFGVCVLPGRGEAVAPPGTEDGNWYVSRCASFSAACCGCQLLRCPRQIGAEHFDRTLVIAQAARAHRSTAAFQACYIPERVRTGEFLCVSSGWT